MTITYRESKGTALSYDELDENFRDLLDDTTIDRVLKNGNTTTKTVTFGKVNTSSLSITNNSYTPPTITSNGSVGQIVWDQDYIYVCIATNTWKRASLVSW